MAQDLALYRTDPSADSVESWSASAPLPLGGGADPALALRLQAVLRRHPCARRRLCLVVPPQNQPEAINTKVARSRHGLLWLPYGFLILAAVAQSLRPAWSVEIVDLHLEALRRAQTDQPRRMEDLCALIPDDCDAYGVTWNFQATEVTTQAVLDLLKARGKFVWCGGVQATFDRDALLTGGHADLVFRREGEDQLRRVLTAWAAIAAAPDVPADGGFVSDEVRACLTSLVNLALVDPAGIGEFAEAIERPVAPPVRQQYDLIDLDAYYTTGGPSIWWRTAGEGKKFATILASRGCRGHCTFCSATDFNGRGVRGRSPEDVIAEIAYLYDEKGVRYLDWIDDDFLADRERSLALIRGIRALGHPDLTWGTSNAVLAISVDEELAGEMEVAGCVMTAFGIETGNVARLKLARKPATHQKIRQACEIVKARPGIMAVGFFIIGFPGETLAEMTETLEFARSIAVDWCTCASLQALPGTAIYESQHADPDADEVKRASNLYTLGRDLVNRGKTFDDYFKTIYDFETMAPDTLLAPDQLSQFQLLFNIRVNMLGNRNLLAGGRPEKILRHCRAMAEAYPMDPAFWAMMAKAAGLLDRPVEAATHREAARAALDASRFWQDFYRVHDLARRFDLA